MKEEGYIKTLGLPELVSLGVGGTMGSGIFVVHGLAAGILGPFSLLAWFIVAVIGIIAMLSALMPIWSEGHDSSMVLP